ncbi:ATP-binding protein [Sphingomonas sp. ABOLD]|uniref:Phage terminase large subunit-like protein n=1 Tax=Sphingomonas trueperi TaxID=53317 RepID=A0A7X6BB70_9SPHN|nr:MULTISPECIES: terminase family protein [Sphingomonas]NJB95835.1 phage terminase large subunit-like protein [Sphingomonas trueperi]RSV47126.1 ATP-binding protein [Sphingomonas sp. ABOLD]
MTPADAEDALARLALAPRDERVQMIREMPRSHLRFFNEAWWRWAHEGQFWPEGDWRVWLIRAGRGFGKTRAGAEWISEMARQRAEARIALVGATVDEVRRVMVEGPAGLLAVARELETIGWHPTRGELVFASGARAFVYSSEAPEKLRGPEHDFAWCDELAKWRAGAADIAWDNLMLGMRRGEQPRVVVTTTPRPVKLMRRVMAIPRPTLHETRGRTRDNIHLPRSFVEAMFAEYAGTRLGRQELDGEMIDDVAGALWPRALIERQRRAVDVPLVRVVVGVDPPAGTEGDACGIVAIGLGEDKHGYVLADASVAGLGPEGWAAAVADCAARFEAECVVAEKNQGGAMVGSVLKAADSALPLRLVHASRGKVVRAEPVALLYERGLVWHASVFAELEAELAGLQACGGYEGPGRSPDRADALVWAVTELMLGRRGKAAVRVV